MYSKRLGWRARTGRVTRYKRRTTRKAQRRWKTKVARVAKGVTLRNLETKVYSGDITASAIYKNGGDVVSASAPFRINVLDQIAEGADEAERTGRQITLKRLNIRYDLRTDGDVGVVYWRFLVGWIQNGTAPSNANMFIGTTGGNTFKFLRRPTDSNSIFTKVLVDKTIRMDQNYDLQPNIMPVVIKVPLHNKKYWFNASTINATNEQLYIVATAFSASGTDLTTQVGVLDGYYRVWYKDG